MSDYPSLRQIIEGAIFASGSPISVDKILSLFEGDQPTREQVRDTLKKIEASCSERGFELKKVASGYRFQVRQEYSKWVSRLWDEKPQRYSRALLETLALIAYKQPITRGDIEDVRGVSVSTNIMRTLLERDWIRVVGHRDVPGRPATYATTKNFLDYFNLSNLDDLPDIVEIDELDKENEEQKFAEVVGDTNLLETEQGETFPSLTLATEETLERVAAEAEVIDGNIHELFPVDEDGNAVGGFNNEQDHVDGHEAILSATDTHEENTSHSESAPELPDEGSCKVGSSLSEDSKFQN